MNPIILVGPAVEPISLAEMKTYLRLDGTDEDELVEALILAARVMVEHHGRLALIEQTRRLALRAWPQGCTIRLPVQPIIGIEAVRVLGEESSFTVPGDEYRTEDDGDVTRVVVEEAAAALAVRPVRIEIDFTCGFGPTPSAIPEPLVLAVRRLVAHWFENRGDEPKPGTPSLPGDVTALIAPFARPRLA